MLGQTLWVVDLALGNTTTIGKGMDHHYWKNNRCLQGSRRAWTSTMGGGNGSNKQNDYYKNSGPPLTEGC